jgi:hypothetical protein
MDARRGWWAGMQKEFGDGASVSGEAEESRTQEVERLAAGP